MRTFKKETKEIEVVDTVICNKCGESLEISFNHAECVKVDHRFGYFSNPQLFGDLTEVRFDLCEKCVFELVKTFVVPAEISTI